MLCFTQPSGKQYQEAVSLIKQAIQLAPSNARYRRSLGVVHESAQQWLAAADAFQRAIEKQPTDIQVGSLSSVYGSAVIILQILPAELAFVHRTRQPEAYYININWCLLAAPHSNGGLTSTFPGSHALGPCAEAS